MSNPKELEILSAPFRALIGNEGLNYQILDLLPIPIEIFSPDGTTIFANRAVLELNNIPDASYLVWENIILMTTQPVKKSWGKTCMIESHVARPFLSRIFPRRYKMSLPVAY